MEDLPVSEIHEAGAWVRHRVIGERPTTDGVLRRVVEVAEQHRGLGCQLDLSAHLATDAESRANAGLTEACRRCVLGGIDVGDRDLGAGPALNGSSETVLAIPLVVEALTRI